MPRLSVSASNEPGALGCFPNTCCAGLNPCGVSGQLILGRDCFYHDAFHLLDIRGLRFLHHLAYQSLGQSSVPFDLSNRLKTLEWCIFVQNAMLG